MGWALSFLPAPLLLSLRLPSCRLCPDPCATPAFMTAQRWFPFSQLSLGKSRTRRRSDKPMCVRGRGRAPARAELGPARWAGVKGGGCTRQAPCFWTAILRCHHGNGCTSGAPASLVRAAGKCRSLWKRPVFIYFCAESESSRISFLRHGVGSLGWWFSSALDMLALTMLHNADSLLLSMLWYCGLLLRVNLDSVGSLCGWGIFSFLFNNGSFRWFCNAVRIEESPVLGYGGFRAVPAHPGWEICMGSSQGRELLPFSAVLGRRQGCGNCWLLHHLSFFVKSFLL